MGAPQPRRRSPPSDLTPTRLRAASVVPFGSALAHLERTFTYLIPPDLAVEVGSVVRVPFHGRRVTGVVIAVMAEPDVPRAVPIAELLGPSIGADLAELGVWLAGRTLSTLGESLQMIVPARTVAVEAEEPSAPIDIPEPGVVPLEIAAVVRAGQGCVWRPARGEDRATTIVSLAASVGRSGRAVIVCTPEPKSSPVAAAMRAAFGEGLADLSSERSPRARYKDWLAVRRGQKRVVLGGRAAVFAPVADLGLVILDDESHTAYKEARAPRYHARTVAAERARLAGVSCVLVGLPLSVEASAATRSGYASVTPDREIRVPVTVIDSPGRVVPASTTLREIADVLAAGGRAVILSHRLPLEQVAERAIRITKPKGPSTLDARSARKDIVRALARADLIIASPVIAAEGAPADATLVAIVGADAALARAEFRAAEETFSTWWRLCANLRAGARVVIETTQPQHAAIDALVRSDPARLVRAEAARRKDLGYPPFGALARIDVPSDRAEEVADVLRGVGAELQVLGPVSEDDRAVIAVRAPRRDVLLAALAPLASAWRAAEEPMRIDVDPWEVFVPRWRSSRS